MQNPLRDSAVRRRFMDELSADGGRSRTAAELADSAGVHVSTARFHLDQLVASRALQTAYERRGVGRPRKVYAIADSTPQDAAEQHARSLQLLSGLLVDMFDGRGDETVRTPEQAGEHWARHHVNIEGDTKPANTPGEWLGKVGGVTDVLRTWGYTPEITTSRNAADLHISHCPFRDMAKANQAVVCGIHRGLLRGAMSTLGEESTDIELLPFHDGETCVAHLRHDPSGR